MRRNSCMRNVVWEVVGVIIAFAVGLVLVTAIRGWPTTPMVPSRAPDTQLIQPCLDGSLVVIGLYDNEETVVYSRLDKHTKIYVIGSDESGARYFIDVVGEPLVEVSREKLLQRWATPCEIPEHLTKEV